MVFLAKNLMVIESPNKIDTLKKYLGKDFDIVATVGHVRDLKRFGMGFDTETFEPQWVIQPKSSLKKETPKKEIVADILKRAAKAEAIYLATDPDREGEAISWHVYDMLPENDQKKALRVTFNEITEEAVLESLKNARQIDKQWVESQFARRIFDRMIGYRLSKLVQKTLRADSAGRVQSVALMFIDDREKEIEKFIPTKWWTLDVVLEHELPIILRSVDPALKVPGIKEDEEKSGIDFQSQEAAELVKNSLGPAYELYSIDDPEYYTRSPREPYKTSTLQQDAVNKLGWQSKKIMSVAQSLYEGVGEGDAHMAYITYPRTDSTRISDSFAARAKEFIISEYGKDYLSAGVVVGSSKNAAAQANTQNAHEAIRPTDVTMTPERVKSILSKDEYALYKLIWVRTVSAFMTPARFKRVTLRFANAGSKFYAFSREMVFDGFRRIYQPYKNDDSEKLIDIKAISEQKVLKPLETKVTEHSTKPPARYTQATLVQELEESGVGRPSTYSTMANVCLDRGYAQLVSRAFVPTEQGRKVAATIGQHFSDVVNKDFTRAMESTLDSIAEGQTDWKEPLRQFWPSFTQKVDQVMTELPPPQDEFVGRNCPLDGAPLVYRYSRRGDKFIGCKNFPSCRHTEPLVPLKVLPTPCPDCGGVLVERINRRGQPFVGCKNFPKCRYLANYGPNGELVKAVPKEGKPAKSFSKGRVAKKAKPS